MSSSSPMLASTGVGYFHPQKQACIRGMTWFATRGQTCGQRQDSRRELDLGPVLLRLVLGRPGAGKWW
jgi:hypothetical protein